jgi:phytoene desaturase
MSDIIIIGAGIGGLSAGIRLASAGKQVTIYEKNDQIGGKMGRFSQAGFTWDSGPSVITMRHVFEELFATAGRQLDDYLTLEHVDPLTRYFFPDDTIVDATDDLNAMADQIRHIDPQDVDGYRRFLEYAADIHRVTGPVFIYDEPPTWRSFLRVPLRDWLKADGLRTMEQAINSHVRSPHMQQLLGRFATYVGGSPYHAPATLNVIADVEMSGGVWYPRGGIYEIARAMKRLAEEVGVNIHTGTGVGQIVVKDKQAAAVTLSDGSFVAADIIISNLDVSTTYQHLLPNNQFTAPKETSCSGFILFWGVNRTHEDLAHHNIFFSRDYRAEFEAIFENRRPADDPTIYVAITSKTDMHHAPPGSENWFVLVNAPSVNDRFDWQTHALPYRDRILDLLADRGVDIRPHIQTERIMTPVDLAQQSGAWRGALYGRSPNNRFAAFQRPHNRAKDVNGLYFVGGTTHPGGGVPMVTLSGRVVAQMILGEKAKPSNQQNAARIPA